MRRILTVLLLAGILATVAFGAAVSMTVQGGTIQSGSDTDLSCDDEVNVLGWGLETDNDKVYFVRLGGIHSLCISNDLWVKVTKLDDTQVVKVGPIHLDASNTGANQLKVSFPAPVPVADLGKIFVWIEGPNP